MHCSVLFSVPERTVPLGICFFLHFMQSALLVLLLWLVLFVVFYFPGGLLFFPNALRPHP